MQKRMHTTRMIALTALCLLTSTSTMIPDQSPHMAHAMTSLQPAHHRRAAATDLALTTPLQRAWDAALSSPAISHASVSAYAYDLTTHRPLAQVNENWQLTPASVMKLFTSAAALSTLGTQFRYHTSVEVRSVYAGNPDTGTIYLVGGGDPWLEADGALDLENMARQIALHIHSARRVVGVNSLYAGTYSGTGWTWDDLPFNYAPNISALTAERDQLNLWVAAGAVGKAPSVTINPLNPSIDPTSPYLQVIDQAHTTLAGPNTITVNRVAGSNQIIITGDIPSGQHVNLFYSLHDPALLAATLLEQLLIKDGVHMADAAGTGALPKAAVPVLVHQSPPLSTYLQIQNTYSINLMAENLFRMLGTQNGGNGSSQAAERFMGQWEKAAGLTPPGTQVDGSGLSPLDEVSARQVVGVLQYAASQPWFKTFEHSLIHIGQTNQCSFMCGLMDQTAADGNVWIKTGNLGNQWNYAGYARAQNGNRIAFAVLLDGLSTNTFYQQAVGVQDQMTVDAASWPSEPSGPATPLLANRLTSQAPSPINPLTLPIPYASGAVIGGEMIAVRSGDVVWSDHPFTRLQPALLPRIALLTTYLQNSNPAFANVTVQTTGTLQHGTLSGNLILAGHGDVNLSPAQMLTLEKLVANAGITHVTGRLQYLSEDPGAPANNLPQSLPWEDFGRAFAPAVQDLATADGTLPITVQPGKVGSPAELTVSAPASVVDLINDTQTTPVGTPAHLFATWLRGTGTYEIQGTVPATSTLGSTPTYTVTVAAPRPGFAAATAFAQVLRAHGITLGGPVTPITSTPTGDILASLPGSAPASITTQALTDPSTALPLALWHALGTSGRQQLSSLTGGNDSIVDPSGLGLENYLTADRAAHWLSLAVGEQSERPLVTALQSHGLWVSTTPEEWSLAGYLQIKGQTYALVLMENGLPWSGHFTPQVGWLPAP